MQQGFGLPIIKRRVNRGGTIALIDIVGRDRFIARLWRTLEQQSIVLGGERRLGKSSVARKMAAEAPAETLAIHRNLENIRTPAEFVERIWDDISQHLPFFTQGSAILRKFLTSIGGAEVKGVLKLPTLPTPQWKTFLEQTLGTLAKAAEASGKYIVFFWDEMPLMLDNIKRQNENGRGEETAMEVLDTLRHLRQTHSSLRMVFTGSVGLHHVLTHLRNVGHANDPTNDMLSVDIPALAEIDAQALALSLLRGELDGAVRIDDPEAVATMIAQSVDCFPFFIHHIVGYLFAHSENFETVTRSHIAEVVTECLVDANNPWALQHYRKRIDTYYHSAEIPLTLALLDAAALSSTSLSFSSLFNRAKSHVATEDDELARRLLELLERDHYLKRESDGTYRFRFDIIARSWRMQRGLDSESPA